MCGFTPWAGACQWLLLPCWAVPADSLDSCVPSVGARDFYALPFGSLLYPALRYSGLQGQVSFFEQVFYRASVQKALYNLILDAFLGAFVRAEIARLGKLTQANQKSSKPPPPLCVNYFISYYIIYLFIPVSLTTITQCKLPGCKFSICASGWMKKHHRCKLQRVIPPCVQVDYLR